MDCSSVLAALESYLPYKYAVLSKTTYNVSDLCDTLVQTVACVDQEVQCVHHPTVNKFEVRSSQLCEVINHYTLRTEFTAYRPIANGIVVYLRPRNSHPRRLWCDLL